MLLEINDIYKDYHLPEKKVSVLKGVSLSINRGEIVAIMGRSGAGKSTLLNVIGTLDRPDKGEIKFYGENVLTFNQKQLSSFRNKNIGFVFQFHYLLPEFTSLENVMMPGLIAGGDKLLLKERAKMLLVKMDLKDRINHRTNELSGGEQQRVAFARALINKPSLILADEPSGNLDRITAEKLHGLMWDFVKEENSSFIVVTHDKKLADNADRIIEISDGVML